MLSDKKYQIIVNIPPSRESTGKSSDSTPTLPYSHGQAVLPDKVWMYEEEVMMNDDKLSLIY